MALIYSKNGRGDTVNFIFTRKLEIFERIAPHQSSWFIENEPEVTIHSLFDMLCHIPSPIHWAIFKTLVLSEGQSMGVLSLNDLAVDGT